MKNRKIIFGMFFLSGIFLFGIISAGSYSSSNPNYGLYKKYDTGSSGSLEWSDEVCQAGQDFVLQIAPFGCEPPVVRSDLLEEQNVPVFCAIAATQINPLIKVEAIESMSFSGQYPKEISGIGFYPARAALGVSGNTNYPILENIGYVVIVLKKQENESAMPNFVEGNLTAKIRYDVKNAFGVGDALFYLPELSENEFEENKNSYSFWNGKFFLRAERIEENYAVVSIYDGIRKISSVTLEKGKTSNKISVPGFNCLAKLQLKLENLDNPGTIVQLKINGEVLEVVKGQKFLDNNCQVLNVESQGIVQKVQLSCYEDGGRNSFWLNIVPKLNISVNGNFGEYSVGDNVDGLTISSIDLTKKGSKEITDIKVTLIDNNKKTQTLYANKPLTIDRKEIELLDFARPQNAELNGESLEYYNNAVADYNTLINNFGDNEYSLRVSYKEYALQEKIKLAEGLEQKKTFNELCEKYENDFRRSYSGCGDLIKLSSSESASTQVLINGEVRDISLERIIDSGFEDYGAKVVIDGGNYNLEKNEFIKIDSNEFIQLIDLSDDSARVNVSLFKSEGVYVSGVKTLKLGVLESFDTNHKITLDDINLKKFAKVSVIPSIDDVGTSANFSFKIGIEKRAIQLAPDEIQKKIDALNETISKWQEREESLGKMVKTMKGACLATSGFLIAKNFLFNQGESLARADVTSVWNQKCLDHMSGKTLIKGKEDIKYTKLDFCLADNSEAIDDAVKSRAGTKKDVSDIFGNLQKAEGVTTEKWAGLEEVVNDNKVWGEIEKSNLLGTLKTDVQNCYGNTVKIDGKDVSVDDLISAKRINENTTTITNLRDMIADAKDCANNPEVAKFGLDKSLATLWANSEGPVKIKEFGEETGFSTASTILSSKDTTIIYVNNFLDYKDVQNKYSVSEDSISGESNVYFVKSDIDSSKKYLVVYDDSGIVDSTYLISSNNSLTKETSANPMKVKFEIVDAGSYKNKFISSLGNTKPVVRYYETSPYKGLPANVPFDLNNGWYVSMSQDVGFGASSASYADSGAVRNYYLCNVGKDGRENDRGGDDKCRMINKGTGQLYSAFSRLDAAQAGKLVQCAEQAIIQASRNYGKKSFSISTSCGNTGTLDVGSPAAVIPDMQCQNFMSPSDCQILFNVCDPVICPSSRCDFGGNYPVADVIQSGIIGGIVLCLPNFVGFGGDVYIPFCLSGIHAGIEGLLSVYTSYRDCLQENLDTGRTVGICDEIYSIYLCEFLWKQALPLAKYSVPKIIEALIGQNVRGGGEYFSFRNALKVSDNSINYFTNYYAANSFEAFKARFVEEVGTEICRNYVSGVGPNIGSMLDSFTEPDSPAQFHGRFDEILFTTATVPATSQYKVFYHIYAGKDSRVYYQVYLKGGAESSYYQDATATRFVASGYISAGEYVSETKDFTAPAGYSKMCIRVNNQEECGFKEVTTSAAINYVKDEYIKSQATETDISTEAECVSGTINTGSVLAGVLSPNIGEGAKDIIEPEIYKRGIIRICAHDNPGVGTDAKAEGEGSRWTQAGWCDENRGIRCWLDTDSVADVIKTKSVEGDTLSEVNENYMDYLRKTTDVSGAESAIDNLNENSDAKKIIEEVNKYFGKLIMNDYKIKALKLRAYAYGILATAKKSEIKSDTVKEKDYTVKEKDHTEKKKDDSIIKDAYWVNQNFEKIKTTSPGEIYIEVILEGNVEEYGGYYIEIYESNVFGGKSSIKLFDNFKMITDKIYYVSYEVFLIKNSGVDYDPNYYKFKIYTSSGKIIFESDELKVDSWYAF